MTDNKPKTVSAALAELREAVREAEQTLAQLQQRGAKLDDQFAAAGGVVTARSALKRAESSLDPDAKTRAATDALARAFNPDTDDQEN